MEDIFTWLNYVAYWLKIWLMFYPIEPENKRKKRVNRGKR